MNGCEVAIIICQDCGKETDETYKYNGDVVCKECFSKKPNKNCSLFYDKSFNTIKDLAYNFTTDVFGNPIVIHSKRQYKKLLKQHGMADASIKECRQEADFRRRLNNEDNTRQRKEFAKDICLKREIKFKARG